MKFNPICGTNMEFVPSEYGIRAERIWNSCRAVVFAYHDILTLEMAPPGLCMLAELSLSLGARGGSKKNADRVKNFGTCRS